MMQKITTFCGRIINDRLHKTFHESVSKYVHEGAKKIFSGFYQKQLLQMDLQI
jgi:hypothetical protein